MTAPAVIRATFSDYRTVKGRKVLQIVMEVPIEQQASVFDALGYPVPDSDIWCAIARLVDEQPIPVEPSLTIAKYVTLPDDATSEDVGRAFAGLTRSEIGKQHYAKASDMEKALVRAARLPKDRRFQDWIFMETGQNDVCDEECAITYIRDTCCAGESRKMIAEDRDCYEAFMKMELQYMQDVGLAAMPR